MSHATKCIQIHSFSTSKSSSDACFLDCAGGHLLEIRGEKILLSSSSEMGKNQHLSLEIPEFSSALIRAKKQKLLLDDSLSYLLSAKALESRTDFQMLIKLYRDGILAENATFISSLVQQWIKKTKLIDQAYETMMNFHSVNAQGFRQVFSKELLHYVVNGLCFRKKPFEAYLLFSAYVEGESGVFFHAPEVEEMIKLIAVGFCTLNSKEFMLVLWKRVCEWYSSGSSFASLHTPIPVKLLTIFVNSFGMSGEREIVLEIFEIWRRHSDLYDAKFYNQLCHAFIWIGGDLQERLKMLVLKNPYSELDPRIVHHLVKEITLNYGRRAALKFLEDLFAEQQDRVTFTSSSFRSLAFEIGRAVRVDEMKHFIQLLEEKGKVIVDDLLVNKLYSGLKRFTRQVSIKERTDCVEFIRKLCQEYNVNVVEKPHENEDDDLVVGQKNEIKSQKLLLHQQQNSSI